MKAQQSLSFSWGLVVKIIVVLVVIGLLMYFIAPKVSASSFSNSTSGFGTWLADILSKS